MLRAALNISWRDHIFNKDLYGKIPKITDTIHEQRLRFSGHCWRSKNEVVSDVLLWLPIHGRRSRGRHAKTFVDQLMEDTSCNYEELPNAMMNREEWRDVSINAEQARPGKVRYYIYISYHNIQFPIGTIYHYYDTYTLYLYTSSDYTFVTPLYITWLPEIYDICHF